MGRPKKQQRHMQVMRATLRRKVQNQIPNETKRELSVPRAVASTAPQNESPNTIGAKGACTENEMPYSVEKEVEKEDEFTMNGKRIVDILFLFQQIALISKHSSLFDCNFSHLSFTGEKRTGLHSKFRLKCNMCYEQFTLETSVLSTDRANINQEAVSGILSIGSGLSHLNTVLSCLNIPSFSLTLYRSVHDTVYMWWKQAAEVSMLKAAKAEADNAKSNHSTNTDGIPLISIVADGCWSKRSYGNNYSALSGAAAIVGLDSKKCLYYGIKNKYCLTCQRAINKGTEAPKHECYRNYTGSSSGMESAIILDGFKKSVESRGLIYSKIIADGDSATYSQLRNKRPYEGLTVGKIYCKNHLLRNYCKAFLAVCGDKTLSSRARNLLKERYLRLRWAVDHIIKYRNSQNLPHEMIVENIRKDILNSPYHIFGEHENCASYFCHGKNKTEENYVTELFVSGVLEKVNNIVFNLAQYSNSLIYNVTSNTVESLNSQIAKYVGGKRINYSSRNSYEARCAAAVIAYNEGCLHTFTHQTIFNTPANMDIVNLERKRFFKPAQKKKSKSYNKTTAKDSSYGENCQKPDLDENTFATMKDQFLKRLSLSAKQRQQLERDTVSQSDNVLWLEYRRKLLTASWFGKVCRKRVTTDCKNLVKAILYGTNLDNLESIKYGKANERSALSQLSSAQGVTIEQCGLFIDSELPFLGATPDGIYKDGIVEVKCPISAKGLAPEAAITAKKITFWKKNKDGVISINKSHIYYYQIQGQLHITNTNVCMFCVWLGDNNMKVEMINRDDQFWKENMEPKLVKFYNQCLLLELIDPRYTRSMELRSHNSHESKVLKDKNEQ